MNKKILLLFFISGFLSPRLISAATIFPAVVPQENQSIVIAGSTVIIKGITDQANKLLINRRETAVGKDGSFNEEVIIPLGATEIEVAVIDKEGNVKTYKKKIEAKNKSLFLVGIADGTLNLAQDDDEHRLNRINPGLSKHNWIAFGKVSYYLAGKVQGKYLIKSALDTGKATQDKLFTNIDPQKYYPIYGDNSTVGYDVNSQGKFYLLVEWDKSGFTVGNYQTMLDETQLAKYNRTLYGAKVNLENPQRTIYGEPKNKFVGFLAEANQYAGHSEFLATGGSLYYLRHRNIVEGSERIIIYVRDKNTGMDIYSLPQKENIDYEIKYDEGRILLKKPVLSATSSDTIISNSILEGNPVYIVADYEYKSQEAFPITSEELNKTTGGARLSQTLGDHIRLGGTYVQEEKAAKHLQIFGYDTSIKVGNFTQLDAEFAQSRAESTPLFISYNGGLGFTKFSQDNSVKDDARRISLNSSLGEYLGFGRDFLDFSSYYQDVGEDFSSTDSLFQAGTTKYGAELAHKLTENDRLRLIAQREGLSDGSLNQAAENQIAAKRNDLYSGQWIHATGNLTFTQEYQEMRRKEPLTAYDTSTMQRSYGERVDYKFNNRNSIFIGSQISISGRQNNQVQLGGSAKVSDKTDLQAQTAFGNVGNSVLVGLAEQKNEFTQTYMNHSITHSKIDGNSSSTAFGANTRVTKDATLRTERQFVTSDQRGVYTSQLTGLECQMTPQFDYGITYQRKEEQLDANLIGSAARDSVSVKADYVKPDEIKANAKIEFRRDTDNTNQLVTDASAELKLTKDVSVFGERQYSDTTKPGEGSIALIDVRHVGLAFRPVKYDFFNCLFKYIQLTDHRPENSVNDDGSFAKMDSDADIYAAEFALDLPYNFQFVEKLAFKREHTSSTDVLSIIHTQEDRRDLLLIHRVNYHLIKKWDAACEYRRLRQKGSDANTIEDGLLFEVTRQIEKYVYIGGGYNFTNFTDDLVNAKRHDSGRGFFLRLQGRY